MGEMQPIFRLCDMRRVVADAIKQGATVKFCPDGSVIVGPPAQNPTDQFDMLDLKK